jgi:hypothetical protein
VMKGGRRYRGGFSLGVQEAGGIRPTTSTNSGMQGIRGIRYTEKRRRSRDCGRSRWWE